MNEELLVHVLEALANLPEDTCCLLLGELAFSLDLLQTALNAELFSAALTRGLNNILFHTESGFG